MLTTCAIKAITAQLGLYQAMLTCAQREPTEALQVQGILTTVQNVQLVIIVLIKLWILLSVLSATIAPINSNSLFLAQLVPSVQVKV